MLEVLNGHTSPETAYIVDDYPYGFRLRCKIRYWIETKKGYGMRLVSQTTNPKKPGEVWNKPKAGTYNGLLVMTRDPSNGHVSSDGLSMYSGPDRFYAFHEAYYHQLDDAGKERFNRMEKVSRAQNPVSWAKHYETLHQQPA
jgi:hypothetical protein